MMTRIFASVFALTLAALASPVPAVEAQVLQTDDVVVVEVPFDFVAGDRQLPAGTYRVELVPNDDPPALVTLQTAAKGDQPDEMIFQSLTTSTVEVDDIDEMAEQPGLVFSKVGNLHFLEEIITP